MTKPTQEPLIAELDKKRQEWGMSIAEWSRRSGVGDATIRHLRRGGNGSSIYTLEALAGVLGYEVCIRPRGGP
jgi:predicted transcriptional regulator